MRDIDRHTHIREMKSITQPDQRQSHNVMSHQLLKILPRLLQPQTQHNKLLSPITRLQQVVRFKNALMRPMWEPLKHARRIEIPHWRPTHHIQTQRSKDREIYGSVDLFHKAVLLCAALDAVVECQRPDESLHKEFAGEREDDDVKAYESEVAGPFTVVGTGFGAIVGVVGDEGVVGW